MIHFGWAMDFISFKNLEILDLVDAPRIPIVLGFKPNSEFLPIFNHFFHRYKEFGLMRRSIDTAYSHQPSGISRTVQDAYPLGFVNLTFPFLGLMFGIFVSSIVGVIEKLEKTFKIWQK